MSTVKYIRKVLLSGKTFICTNNVKELVKQQDTNKKYTTKRSSIEKL